MNCRVGCLRVCGLSTLSIFWQPHGTGLLSQQVAHAPCTVTSQAKRNQTGLSTVRETEYWWSGMLPR